MSLALIDRASRVRLSFLGALCSLVCACGGVAPEAVRDTTSSITAHVALAKASLVACRGGDRAQCDSAEKNLEAIASSNAQLDQLSSN
jgi:hypothetical protein